MYVLLVPLKFWRVPIEQVQYILPNIIELFFGKSSINVITEVSEIGRSRTQIPD